ncbi:MAG: DEAD/DEAH box helicase family protein [Verrucomicrobiota bacterium]|jgi:type I restriction enzyme R subunit|nr:DEAD/DEAH box helicase family protein [Verrucomicrobiota bacterium]
MPANTKEWGLESLIAGWLVSENGYEQGQSSDYNKEFALDETRLFRFLQTTQPKAFAMLGVTEAEIKKEKFLSFLRGEITKRGIIDVLRKGLKCYPVNEVILFYQTPSEKNVAAKANFDKNIFSVTRQLMYSNDNTKLALDLCLFINGLPIITVELKNQLTKQDVDDAVYQYQNDRDPRELLFNFKRCMVHFAVDDSSVMFCTKLDGKKSWFLPFNKGYDDGAGNPPNPNGLMTDYLWRETFTKTELANIIENYAQVVEEKDGDTKKTTYKQIFPRYHQLAVVKALLADVKANGIGKRYLIQHSAGSGKSNSIAWLAHQLVGLERGGKNVVDSVIVVTDRVNLDKQINSTIKQFMQVKNTVTHAEKSEDLRTAIATGKKIIITTVHKFPFILDAIGTEHKGHQFAIIIDEAHSSQSGSMSAKMNMALSGEYDPEGHDDEDFINILIENLIKTRKMLPNASYFAFTATPKQRTLRMFGTAVVQPDGDNKYYPFHEYTMKQAIQEGFILDVLKNYMPVQSYWKLVKTVTDDPKYDKKKAQKKLKKFVERDNYSISQKAEVMVENFYSQVIARGKIGGKAKAMVVTGGIELAIEYYYDICRCLEARKSPYKAIIAFSGEKEYQKKMLTEADINGFPSSAIEKEFKKDEYRFLVVADKFQTGYDEPLLHTMYVDKALYDIKAVQTLSRLNRAYPGKHDTFVLDFFNKPEEIQEAFQTYYRTTALSGDIDPNKLYELLSKMEQLEVYDMNQVNDFIALYLSGADRDKLDPVLDVCVADYKKLDEDKQVEFKGSAKAFVRTYSFLSAVLPYGNADWEKTYIFLSFLIRKLPSPVEEDLAQGILDAIDLQSYRSEAGTAISIQLEDSNAEIDPATVGGGKKPAEPEMDVLSSIITSFNDLFGNIEWKDSDNVRRQITEIPAMVSKDETYQNAMKNSDKQNARMESDRVLAAVMAGLMSDNIDLYKLFVDNPSFKKWLSDMVFNQTYQPPPPP